MESAFAGLLNDHGLEVEPLSGSVGCAFDVALGRCV